MIEWIHTNHPPTPAHVFRDADGIAVGLGSDVYVDGAEPGGDGAIIYGPSHDALITWAATLAEVVARHAGPTRYHAAAALRAAADRVGSPDPSATIARALLDALPSPDHLEDDAHAARIVAAIRADGPLALAFRDAVEDAREADPRDHGSLTAGERNR